MRLRQLLAAAAITLAGSMASSGVLAAPLYPATSAVDGLDVIQVQREDCHESIRRHYLREFGRRVEHYHTGRRCRVVLADEYEDEYGGDYRDDCHRQPERHFLPEFGRSFWHQHTGRSCRVVQMQEYRGRRQGQGCVQMGPFSVCP